jgi:hypothetical protein
MPLAFGPALPLHAAGKYVAAAYIIFFVLVLIYVAIMALRLSHLERDLGELLTLTEDRSEDAPPTPAAPNAAAERVSVGATTETGDA